MKNTRILFTRAALFFLAMSIGNIFSSSFLFSQGSDTHQAFPLRITQPIVVDGRLDEPIWNESQKMDGFIQKEPKEGEPATEPTEVRILYDTRFLYIGLLCYDSRPDKIVANEMRRDAVINDNDYFEIFIDTFHDHRNAFYFATNPLGARRDALIRDEGNYINWNWDGIWQARAIRTQKGWAAEIVIPFYTLRFKKGKDMTWGINFGRQVARKREESFWSPVLRDLGWFGKYRASAFGHLIGLENIKQENRIQVMPYFIGGGFKEEDDESFSSSGDLGLDLKYSLTSNLTVDVTVNTDFAQVEADQEQFNLTRFSLFLPEKRGFFLEGADIFQVGERYNEFEPPKTLLFFSRAIGLSEDGKEIPIIGGLRVTGKTGRYDLGILNILTDRISYIEDDEQINIERTDYSVFRLKRDFLKKSTLGVMFLNKESLDSSFYNRGACLDLNLALGPSFKMGGFAAKTFTHDLKEKDWATHVDFLWDSNFFGAQLTYTDIGENFNSELGFISRVDIRKIRMNFGIGPRPNFLNLRQTLFFGDFSYIENHSGQLESKSLTAGTFNIFQNGSFLFLAYIQNYEYLSEEFEIKEDVFIPVGVHKFKQFMAFYDSDKSKRIAFRTETNIGQFYNGHLYRINARGILKLSKHINMEFIYDRNQIDLPIEGGKFTTNIAASRLIYTFNPDLFAKAYVQWNSEENLFKSNFLIRWIYKPGANVYFIYNETRKLGSESYLQDRLLMLKVSFLFN